MRNWMAHDCVIDSGDDCGTLRPRTDATAARTPLGAAPGILSSRNTLSWKTYHWEMRTVWLQNVMLHQPKRWLPEKISELR